MSHNIAAKSKKVRDKINVDLAASGIAFKEHMNQPVIPQEVERQQPEEHQEYFRYSLQNYRNLSLDLPKGTNPVYLKGGESNRNG